MTAAVGKNTGVLPFNSQRTSVCQLERFHADIRQCLQRKVQYRPIIRRPALQAVQRNIDDVLRPSVRLFVQFWPTIRKLKVRKLQIWWIYSPILPFSV